MATGYALPMRRALLSVLFVALRACLGCRSIETDPPDIVPDVDAGIGSECVSVVDCNDGNPCHVHACERGLCSVHDGADGLLCWGHADAGIYGLCDMGTCAISGYGCDAGPCTGGK